MLYGVKSIAELASDLVIEIGNDTYVCNYDPTKINRAAGAPELEQQNIWQIICYRQTTVQDGETEINRTQALYPEGMTTYAFAPVNIANYNFTYRV